MCAKGALFWPDVLRCGADSYNDSFGHSYTPLTKKVHPEMVLIEYRLCSSVHL